MRWMIALIALAMPAAAQQINCTNPLTQHDMNYCAGQEYNAADAQLNAVYKMAVAKMRELDSYNPGLQPSNVELLRQAQRAWIPFRDAACLSESVVMRGGSMQSLFVLTCKTRLTQQRSQDLYGMSQY